MYTSSSNTIHPAPHFPLEVQYFRYLRPIRFPPHRHDSTTFVICLRGRLLSEQFDGTEVLEPGHVLVTNSGVLHASAYCIDGNPTEGLSIDIKKPLLERILGEKESASSVTQSPVFKGVMYLTEAFDVCRGITEELQNGEIGSRFMIESIALQTVVRIVRMWKRLETREQDELPSSAPLLPRSAFIRSVEFMSNCPHSEFRVGELCRAVGISRSNLVSQYKATTGRSPQTFFNELKVMEARERLADSVHNLKGVAGDLGFRSERTFFRVFKSVTGQTPGEYRRVANVFSEARKN